MSEEDLLGVWELTLPDNTTAIVEVNGNTPRHLGHMSGLQTLSETGRARQLSRTEKDGRITITDPRVTGNNLKDPALAF